MAPNELLKYDDVDRLKHGDETLSKLLTYDQVIAPVLFNNLGERQQCVLVHIAPKALTATLYFRPNSLHDNSKPHHQNQSVGDISECVLNMLELASNLEGKPFDDSAV